MKTLLVPSSGAMNGGTGFHPGPSDSGSASPNKTESGTGALIGAIRKLRACAGDELNDQELTQLLHAEGLPPEAGFSFLCLSDGRVTFRVPQLEAANWYREGGWPSVAKEEIGKAVATKYRLHVYEPPDDTTHGRHACGQAQDTHHHLVLGTAAESIIVAHPSYLKIRLFCTESGSRYLSDARLGELLGPELLRDLSALYRD